MSDLLNSIEEIVRQAGEILLHADRSALHTDAKAGNANFVTAYDRKVQAFLQKELLTLLPEAAFVGEEEDIHPSIRQGYAYIVDPIDGTLNFIRDRKESAVSVCLTRDGQPVLGVVYNPYTNAMYTAEKGQGAFKNGSPIHVSDYALEQGLVLFGSASYYGETYDLTFQKAREYFDLAMDLRRGGSAALDCCAIAEGKAELFFEVRLYPWDVAAGIVLVEEAGGVVTNMDGGPVSLEGPGSVLITNRKVRE